ncbi:hypothetical protein BACINT_04282 [Bacteroides intestinalis DSM 17393]|uniref:Uncharacterized protein n=1 Tax=Bacteroides intestinalis DSM 17393 TaxID=471870 RepID=B3CFA4_9BACE|nr:hypothetical protein BACINT_04282 [Bacteroides intestinalis DSM 17393]
MILILHLLDGSTEYLQITKHDAKTSYMYQTNFELLLTIKMKKGNS